MSRSGLEENIRRRYITETDGRFSELSDEQLAAAIRADRPPAGDGVPGSAEIAADIQFVDGAVYSELLNRFTDMMIFKIANISLSGLDAYDLMQVCAMGLLCAAISYSSEGGASFATYASRCIDNRINSALKTGKRQKNLPLNEYTEFSEVVDTVLIDPDSDPETRTLIDESVSEMTVQMIDALTGIEHDAFFDLLKGLSYEQISQHLGISVKAVDNAIQRARRKLRSLFKGGHDTGGKGGTGGTGSKGGKDGRNNNDSGDSKGGKGGKGGRNNNDSGDGKGGKGGKGGRNNNDSGDGKGGKGGKGGRNNNDSGDGKGGKKRKTPDNTSGQENSVEEDSGSGAAG